MLKNMYVKLKRLLVTPLLATLQHAYPGRAEIEQYLLSLLDKLRGRGGLRSGLWTSKPDHTPAFAPWESLRSRSLAALHS